MMIEAICIGFFCTLPASALDDRSGNSQEDPLVAALSDQLRALRTDRQALAESRTAAEFDAVSEPAARGEEIDKLRHQFLELLSAAVEKPNHASSVNEKRNGTERDREARSIQKPTHAMQERTRTESAQSMKQADRGAEPAGAKSVDRIALAQSLFRAREFDASLAACRSLELARLKPEGRAAVQYVAASCLRQLGRPQDAAPLYSEVASFKNDETLAQSAQWQLSTMNWRQELATQLDSIRRRRRAFETDAEVVSPSTRLLPQADPVSSDP